MLGRRLRLSLRAAAVVLAASGISMQSLGSVAQAVTLTQQQVAQFLANPGNTLTQNPRGGADLVQMVRDLVLSAPVADRTNVLNATLALLDNANPAQQSAIGAGLGSAVLALLTTDPAFANEIQAALAKKNNPTAIAAYSGVTGNVVIGAAGGGGGGGGGGPTTGGPSPGGVAGPLASSANQFIPTGGFSLAGFPLSGTTGSGAGSITNNITNNVNITGSVSP